MANWTDSVKLDFLWKWMFCRSRGDSASQFYEENIPLAVDVHASDVYADVIPITPPTGSTATIKKWYPVTDGGVSELTLTRDRKYNGGRVWVALTDWSANWSSGSGDVRSVLKNFVSPRYGRQYVVRVFDGAGNQVSELDSVSWIFNYRSGVLTFEADRAESGVSQATSIKLRAYQYVGKTVADGGGSSGGLGNRTVDRFDAVTAGTYTYRLSRVPQDSSLVDAYLNGILLTEGDDDDYTLNGDLLELTPAVETCDGDRVTVKYW